MSFKKKNLDTLFLAAIMVTSVMIVYIVFSGGASAASYTRGDVNTSAGGSQWDTSAQTGDIGSGATIYWGEDLTSFSSTHQNDINSLDELTSTSDSDSLENPVPEVTGQYAKNGATNDGNGQDFNVTVIRPKISTFEIRNNAGADVSEGTLHGDQNHAYVYVRYNYYTAEDIELTVITDGGDGLDVTESVLNTTVHNDSTANPRDGFTIESLSGDLSRVDSRSQQGGSAVVFGLSPSEISAGEYLIEVEPNGDIDGEYAGSSTTITIPETTLNATFETYNGWISNDDNTIDVEGSASEQESVAVVLVDRRGNTNAVEVSVDEQNTFEQTEISLSDADSGTNFVRGTVTGHVISMGGDQEVGSGVDLNAGDSNVANIADLVNWINGNVSGNGDQVRTQLRSKTVNASGSDDKMETERFRLTRSNTQITNVGPESDTSADTLEPGETMVIQGTTNRRPGDNEITVDLLTQQDGLMKRTRVGDWNSSGKWSATLPTEDVEEGTYVVSADDGDVADRREVEIVGGLQPPGGGVTTITAVDHSVISGETLEIRGTTNLNPIDFGITIELLTQQGELVKKITYNHREKSWSTIIDTEDIPPGTYIITADGSIDSGMEVEILSQPNTQITNVGPKRSPSTTSIQTGQMMLIEGTTNQRPSDTDIIVELLTQQGELVEQASIEIWDSSGEWSATLNTDNVDPGIYVVSADDGYNTYRVEVDISSPTPTVTPTETPTETQEPPPTPTSGESGPGFGFVVSIIALFGAAYLAVRRRW